MPCTIMVDYDNALTVVVRELAGWYSYSTGVSRGCRNPLLHNEATRADAPARPEPGVDALLDRGQDRSVVWGLPGALDFVE